MQSRHKGLVPDGNRRKPPIFSKQSIKKRNSLSGEMSSSSRPNSTTSEGLDSSEEEEDCTLASSDSSDLDTTTDDGIARGLDTISEEKSMKKFCSDESALMASSSSSSVDGDESNTMCTENKWSSTDEESSFYKDRTPHSKYDTTCCDDDFTWVRSESSFEKSLGNHKSPSLHSSKSRKPPRPSAESEHKRHHHARRQERDYKSRSTHSLREKSSSGEISKGTRRDTGYQSESLENHRRGSPGFRTFLTAPPPPPPYHPDYYHDWYCAYGAPKCMDDRRGCNCNAMQLEMHRYGSAGMLYGSHENISNGSCCSRCQHHRPGSDRKHSWNSSQRQDVDERIRRLQGEKDTLAHQVQALTEQVSAQNDKIVELEKGLTDKTQLLNNTEDMLQREILSRSSLETQKLELISTVSELKLQQAALERENLELRASHVNNNSLTPRRPNTSGKPTSASVQNISLGNSAFHGSIGSLQQTSSSPMAPKTPPASFRHQVNPHFNSLPRSAFTTSINGASSSSNFSTTNCNSMVDNNANPKQRNVAFAESEKVIENSAELMRGYSTQLTTSPPLGQKSKGLRSIFGKMRRSNSGNLEDLPGEGEFKRGGIRATAGPRLGWSQNSKPMKAFKEWDVDDLCVWFDDMGLSCYEEDIRRWIKNGSEELVNASPVDIEKELNLKSPLHRKKIVLALDELSGKETDDMMINAGKLDTAWVMRWLDDIGLPQHKDSFSATRIDGRMLHKLTMEDLANLHITSCLHVASLRRGIQVMRENNWNPDCLIRRSSTDENKEENVGLWTAHRVMEWLRVVDLAEYAPNLRGAGVHGALMIYEPRFTAELLADLLSIPPSKTLLRRHLATHFKDLLGRDIIQKKRDVQNTLGYQPLTVTAKIKTPKKSQFSLKRKKSLKSGDEWSDYVCPMGPSGDHLPSSNTSNQSANGISMTSVTVQDTGTESEAASLPTTSAGSPTSIKSSNSTS